jgi:hypothetical protein
VKKILGTLFLSILLLQVAGSYVYFVVRLSGIRQEMREQLKHKPDEELTLLTLTPDEYKKSRVDDHEVKVNGKMYDIARMTVRNNQVLVYALHDEAEDNLLTLLNEMVERSSKDKKPVPSQLIQLLTLQFEPVVNKIPSPTGIWIKHLTPYFATLPAIDGSIESPPPRV